MENFDLHKLTSLIEEEEFEKGFFLHLGAHQDSTVIMSHDPNGKLTSTEEVASAMIQCLESQTDLVLCVESDQKTTIVYVLDPNTLSIKDDSKIGVINHTEEKIKYHS